MQFAFGTILNTEILTSGWPVPAVPDQLGQYYRSKRLCMSSMLEQQLLALYSAIDAVCAQPER